MRVPEQSKKLLLRSSAALSKRTQSAWPFFIATSRAEEPLLLLRCSARDASSCATTSAYQIRAAINIGDAPLSLHLLTSPWAETSRAIISACRAGCVSWLCAQSLSETCSIMIAFELWNETDFDAAGSEQKHVCRRCPRLPNHDSCCLELKR